MILMKAFSFQLIYSADAADMYLYVLFTHDNDVYDDNNDY